MGKIVIYLTVSCVQLELNHCVNVIVPTLLSTLEVVLLCDLHKWHYIFWNTLNFPPKNVTRSWDECLICYKVDSRHYEHLYNFYVIKVMLSCIWIWVPAYVFKQTSVLLLTQITYKNTPRNCFYIVWQQGNLLHF